MLQQQLVMSQFIWKKDQVLDESVFERNLLSFKKLRVMVVHKLKIQTVPSYISKLKHLRYLDLSDSDILTLPNSITKLQSLQTLKLNHCYGLVELPRDIRKLVSLRHLELRYCHYLSGMPCGLGQVTSLLTLTRFVTNSSGSRLNELQSLNNLRGRLSIRILGIGYSSSGQCSKNATTTEKRMDETNFLEAKEFLKTLEVYFFSDEDNCVLLESLCPHPNLKELKIYYFQGVSSPSWMMVDIRLSIPNLVSIDIENCHKCKHLPLFGQLPSLQFLKLYDMDSVEYIDNNTGSGEESLTSLSGEAAAAARRREPTLTPTFFPLLKSLVLPDLPNLKGWWRSKAEEEKAARTSFIANLPDQQQLKSLPYWLPSFSTLSTLSITNCPNLASIPILQPCLEVLHLDCVSKKLVQQLLMMTMSLSSSSSLLLHLPKLKYLSLGRIYDLVTLPEWIGNLTSLEKLHIFNCPKLTSLPEGMRRLTTFQEHRITYCSQGWVDESLLETKKIAHFVLEIEITPATYEVSANLQRNRVESAKRVITKTIKRMKQWASLWSTDIQSKVGESVPQPDETTPDTMVGKQSMKKQVDKLLHMLCDREAHALRLNYKI
ncbi:putative disease resistance protein RGA3 [Cornus florida]|uniref:putative disease resistance protein RGA3 n=1 Tax=Cornus florida TaxID=4283 RepID=UPI0028A06547|nr:putative disease resistance protein RGA3 [Cornus florida]